MSGRHLAISLALLGGCLIHAPLVAAATPPQPATAQAGGALVTGPDLHRQIEMMKADLKPDTSLLWRPVITADGLTAALEYWHKPRPPAAHITEAEYVMVVEGHGWMVSGGTFAHAQETHPGLLEGDEITGGVSRDLGPGDVFLIPAGMPHWFGIRGEGLVLLGTKIPASAPRPKP
ncbi:cupin domain-containing protein [Novosphingobium rosa]|uniref:cupin domain-containing protein n=1 Tax=Novosphingobium rosa TaxID=76978 RepID=UPI000A00AE0D|nr:cupin domain-containing protein [Novosphingobium rosa]